MQLIRLLRLLLALSFFFSMSAWAAKPVFFITPTQKAPSIIYSGQIITAIYQITNTTPYALNGSGLINLPLGIIQSGGTCAAPVFNLAAGESCSINLQITADQLQGNVSGGPIVCNTPQHQVYCSQPSLENELSVVKNTTLAMISASPTSLLLTRGGLGQIVTITNNSSIDAFNVGISNAPGLGIIVSGACASPLAPGATCQLTFTPSSSTGTTTATIKGVNTTIVTTNITVGPALPTTLNITTVPSPAVIPVNGAGLQLSIQNTGITPAYNVVDALPNTWNGVNVTGSCGTIAPGNICFLTVTATQPNLANSISFSGDNVSTVQSPQIAFSYYGYPVASTTGASPGTAFIIQPSDPTGGLPWDSSTMCSGGTSCTVTGAASLTDGMTNTADIVAALTGVPGVTSNNYAPGVCYSITSDNTGTVPNGTWYTPAMEQWRTIYNTLYVNGFGGFSSAAIYWSSTETLGSGDAYAYAWVFSNGTPLDPTKNNTLAVRCARNIAY